MRVRLVLLAILSGALTACGTVRAPKAPERAEPLDDADVRAAADAYADALAVWGTWERDRVYGTRWCPSADRLLPSPADYSPVDERDPWTAITSRGGRWIHDFEDRGRWCWVPSLAATGLSIAERAKAPSSGADAPPNKVAEVVESVGDVALGTLQFLDDLGIFDAIAGN